VDICEFHAPELVETEEGVFTARINASLCKGCGTCTSWCPSGAIVSKHFTSRQVHAMIDAFFDEVDAKAPVGKSEEAAP
jgi:heterodisulfide reductase subunit A